MKMLITLGAALLIAWRVVAEAPLAYYDAVVGKQGAELRAALHQCVTNRQSVTPPWFLQDVIAQIDGSDDCRGAVLTVYGGGLRATLSTQFAYPNDCGLQSGWEIERFWPASYGLQTSLSFCDLHNVRPAVYSSIQARAEHYFGLKDTTPYFTNGAIVFPLPETNVFNPPISDRGQIARSLFYMDVAYEGDRGYADLQLVDDTRMIKTNATNFGRLSTLLQWHKDHPVTERERRRNDKVFEVQKNRNPFVDHPEFADTLYGLRIRAAREGTNMVLRWAAPYNTPLFKGADLRRWTYQRFTQASNEMVVIIPITGTNQFFYLGNP